MPCNSGQSREHKTLYLCGICNPRQAPATPDRTLEMSSKAVRAVVQDPYFIISGRTSDCHLRRFFLAEKARLPASFWALQLCHSLPFLVSLLLEPAVNEGAH